MPPSRQARRWILGSALALLLCVIIGCGQTVYLLVGAWWHDNPSPHRVGAGQADDASRMNATRVAEVWDIPADPAEAERQLSALLQRARQAHLPIAIAGARHSMGGHTIAADGIVINMLPFNRMEVDAAAKVLRVGAGARWKEIIPYLDRHGLSVAIMQSNHDFSVGGSLSVNCHGWQHNKPPIASSVRALRVLRADGAVVRCSRAEHAELFALCLGGYGLFGVILEAELDVVANERYRPDAVAVPTARYVEQFRRLVTADVGMVYGRVCVCPGESYLREAILTVFRREPCKLEEIPSLKEPGYTTLRREVYRAQIGSQAGKELRWKAEKLAARHVGKHAFSRNQLLNEPAAIYQEQNADRADILHEYFIPVARLEDFLVELRQILPGHPHELLNITLRNVLEDRDTVLRYADQEMFAFVMLFNQERTPAADRAMAALTRELIDAAARCGGRYYLPYRLHATPAQFERAYPQAPAWRTLKQRYDPEGLFRNAFYNKYGLAQGT